MLIVMLVVVLVVIAVAANTISVVHLVVTLFVVVVDGVDDFETCICVLMTLSSSFLLWLSKVAIMGDLFRSLCRTQQLQEVLVLSKTGGASDLFAGHNNCKRYW